MRTTGSLNRYVAYADAHLTWAHGVVDERSANRCHVVAVVAASGGPSLAPTDEVLVCESVQGWRFLPGGTREPGESIPDLIARELLEEAGAQATSPPRLVGGWNVHSCRPAPYRPHLAHPRAVWALAQVPVRRVGPPTCPPDGEQIVAVRRMPAQGAVEWLAGSDDDLHAAALEALLTQAS